VTQAVLKPDAREEFTCAVGIATSSQLSRQQHIFFGGERGDELIGLEHKTDLASSHHRQLVFRHSRDIHAIENHGAGRNCIEAGKQAQQRAFPASGRTHDSDEFPARDVQIDALENFNPVRTCINRFRELPDFYDELPDGIALAILYYGFVTLRTLSSCVYLVVALGCHAFGAPSQPLIVAFGDSLSAGFGADPGKSYPDYLQKLIDRSNKNFKVYNAGVSGDTTTDGLQRLPGILALKPEIVILELGGNDGLRGIPPEVTKANMAQMIQPLLSQGAKVVLAGMTLPRNYGPAYIHRFEQIYTQLSAQYHLTLIPFLLQGVADHPDLMQRDSIHPTGEGNKLVAVNVYKYLRPLL